jgi:hypothetical protein
LKKGIQGLVRTWLAKLGCELSGSASFSAKLAPGHRAATISNTPVRAGLRRRIPESEVGMGRRRGSQIRRAGSAGVHSTMHVAFHLPGKVTT